MEKKIKEMIKATLNVNIDNMTADGKFNSYNDISKIILELVTEHM